MTSNKTKKLLEDLKEITQKPRPKEPVYRPISNQYGEDENGKPIYIDRMYGDLYGNNKLILKSGHTYKGKIYKKRHLITSKDLFGNKNNFYSKCYVTADGRWFDQSGMPMDAPKKVDDEEQVATVEVQKTELTSEEKLHNEQSFLKGLK